MAQLYTLPKSENTYYDRKNYDSLQQYLAAIEVSSTVYVGNLSFFTTQDSIRQLFSLAGKVKRIIMGIDNEGHPCGFCFVIFQTHEQAGNAVQFISRTKLNGRFIRVDWDPGYKEGREKGRGTGGQQRRDDFRNKEDSERPRRKPVERERHERSDRQDHRGHDHGDREYRRKERNYGGEERYRSRDTRKNEDEGY